MNTKINAEKFEIILNSACELFANRDFHNVSMDDIAGKAGVGKGTLYNYFASKEDLYYSIIKTRLSNLIEILENAYSRRNDTLKNLRSIILHLHKFMSKHPHFYMIWKKEENRIDSDQGGELKELRDRIFCLIDRILAQGEEQGIIRKNLKRNLLTYIIMGMVDGLKKSQENVFKKEDSIDELLMVIMMGIGLEHGKFSNEPGEFRHKRG